MLRRLGLEAEQRPGNREYQLTHEAAEALRAEHQRIQALHRRSMKLAAAARALKVALSTAALMSRNWSAGRRPRDRLQRSSVRHPRLSPDVLACSQTTAPAGCPGRSRRTQRSSSVHRPKREGAEGPGALGLAGAAAGAADLSVHSRQRAGMARRR